MPNGIKLYALNWDVLASCLLEPITDIYPKRYFSGKVVIDVGAYIGDTTLLFAKAYQSSQVIAYEPHPVYYKLLRINMKLNKVDNVKAFNKAVLGVKDHSQILFHRLWTCYTCNKIR